MVHPPKLGERDGLRDSLVAVHEQRLVDRLARRIEVEPSPGSEPTMAAEEPAKASSATLGLSRGDNFGRYVLLDALGAGAMGAVLAAYDPVLERRVAIKVLLPHRESWGVSDGQRRLMREAQAMAKLDHPNVVAIHDVGEHDGRVFIAMDLVEGCTLTTWLAQEKRRWTEVLRVYVAAARGLVAAHARGVVHRDFKPDNVMIDESGRVRVMDFGLAFARRTDDRDVSDSVETDSADDDGSTWGGSMVGTPAYMPPEVFVGEPAGAASDQFSFCVAMWEGLYGVRPFRGSTLEELAAAIMEGRRECVPSVASVPTWLRRIVERGLGPDPLLRYPQMTDLLAALESGRNRARGRTACISVGLMGLVTAGALGHQRVARAQQVAACNEEGQRIALLWDGTARERLRAAIVGTGLAYAPTTAERVIVAIDGATQRWALAAERACLASTVERHPAWTEQTGRRAAWCLERERLHISAVVDKLSRGDARNVVFAVRSASELGTTEPCVDPDALRDQPPPPEPSPALRRAREKIADSRAHMSTGDYAEGLEAARAAVSEAQRTQWTPIVAQARAQLGQHLIGVGRYDEAEPVLEQAFFEATRAGADGVAATTADHLVTVVGEYLARPTEGERWGKWADLLREGLRDPGGLRGAVGMLHLAGVLRTAGDHARAQELLERALAILETELGPEHPRVASATNNLAELLRATGDPARALEMQLHALDLRERALGPDHPHTVVSHYNVGAALLSMGRYEAAHDRLRTALALARDAYDHEHPLVSGIVNNLAIVHHVRGDLEAAAPLYEQALEGAEHNFGPEHPDVAGVLANFGELRSSQGRYVEARRLLEDAVAIRTTTLGYDHLDTTAARANLASVLHRMGEIDRARSEHEAVLSARQQQLGEEHPKLAWSLLGLSAIARDEDRAEDAVSFARRAVAVRDSESVPLEHRAVARWELAQSLDAAGDEAAALATARDAAALYDRAGDVAGDEAEALRSWLLAHAR